MKKISLKKVAVGATIIGLSSFAGYKMYQKRRPKIGASDIKDPNAMRFSHQYPESNETSVNSSLQVVGENNFVSEEQSLEASVSPVNPTLQVVEESHFVSEKPSVTEEQGRSLKKTLSVSGGGAEL